MPNELIIIGGGPLGTIAAMEAARNTVNVLLLRRRDQPTPNAEGLRNQAWLQSGLHYAHLDLVGARFIRDAATALRRRFRLAAPPRGTMCVLREHLGRFRELANSLNLPIAEVEFDDAAIRMCRFRIRNDVQVLDVPDGPFPEADVMRLARDDAQARGAQLLEVDEPVRLEPASVSSGVVVCVGTKRLVAKKVLVTAGSGTPALLQGLDINLTLKVMRTPLLIIKQELLKEEIIKTPLLVDRKSGYSIVSPTAQPWGRLVFGVKSQSEINPNDDGQRTVPQIEQDTLLAKFEEVTGITLHRDAVRFSGGFEIFDAETTGIEEVLPRYGTDPRYPGLLWALPGRATLSYQAAMEALRRLELTGQRSRDAPVLIESDVASDWTGPIRMHHHRDYDSTNDAMIRGG